MPDQIDPAVKHERAARMIEISNRKSVEYRKKFIGSRVEILSETLTNGVVDGLTDNYIRVFVKDAVELGKTIEVELIAIEGDGMTGRVL